MSNSLVRTSQTDPALQQKNLHQTIQRVDYFVRRNYLGQLPTCPVIPLPTPDTTKNLRLFRIDKIIYDDNEDINEKLTSVYGAMQNLNVSVFTLVIGTKKGVEYYWGTRSEEAAGIPAEVLESSFAANFPGSELHIRTDTEMNEVLSRQKFDNICSVTVVPSAREDNEKSFIQGIEKMVDAMQGEEYSALFISTPIRKSALDTRRQGLEQLYTAISPHAKTTFAYGENQSDAISEGSFTNFAHTINEGVSNTFGSSVSTTEGFSSGSGGEFSWSESRSKSESHSSSHTDSFGTADTTGGGTNTGKTFTSGTNKTLTKETIDKTAENVLASIDEQFERFKQFEAFGAWETAAYFCSAKIESSIVAANTFRALALGENSNTEYSCVNLWDVQNANTDAVAKYLRYCQHPMFQVAGGDTLKQQTVTAGNFISGKELAIFMSLPHKSVPGVSVTTMAEFSRNISCRNTPDPSARTFKLGCIHHMSKDEEENRVRLDLDSLTSHCFICGSTGSGKSNTTYHLLQKLISQQVPFLAIEPAKGEYKTVFGNVDGIHIYGTNPNLGAMLKINPFEFHPNIHILEHLDRLIEIFNACWEMYAAMPAILKNAIEKAYIRKGWDLQNSFYTNPGAPQYPTFADVLAILPKIIRNSSYSTDTQSDYTGALVTRVGSLTNGITGQIFCDNYYISDKTLFDENTVVDLSRIGSTETKSLIMGILVMRLNEYRMANATGSNRKLMHVTVLEEAHNLLKNVSQAQGQQTANPIGKSVEMICNSIAEMRTYGEGFIIVDQSPSSVDIAAIKNTNTKIAMRLPEQHDCEAIGKSLGLNEAQTKELSKLPVGVAVVLQNNWLEPVLCKISRADESRYQKEQVANTFEQLKQLRGSVLESLITQYQSTKNIDLAQSIAVVDAADVSTSVKDEMKQRLTVLAEAIQQPGNVMYYYTSLLYISGLNGLLMAASDELAGRETDKDYLTRWHAKITQQLPSLIGCTKQNMYPAILMRCIFAMRQQSSRANYEQIYDTLYKQE